MIQRNMNRRHFLRGSSAALALTALRSNGLDFFTLPSARRVALIGTGWYGKSDLFRLMQVAPVEVVALCDADKHQLEHAAGMVLARNGGKKKPALYSDHREMLQAASPDIVLIGSPDHWHALQAIDAMKAGAHVYVQKPISVDVIEGEAMVAAGGGCRTRGNQ